MASVFGFSDAGGSAGVAGAGVAGAGSTGAGVSAAGLGSWAGVAGGSAAGVAGAGSCARAMEGEKSEEVCGIDAELSMRNVAIQNRLQDIEKTPKFLTYIKDKSNSQLGCDFVNLRNRLVSRDYRKWSAWNLFLIDSTRRYDCNCRASPGNLVLPIKKGYLNRIGLMV